MSQKNTEGLWLHIYEYGEGEGRREGKQETEATDSLIQAESEAALFHFG